MAREIKFRAFDKQKKRMFDVYGLGKDFVTEDTLDGVDEGNNCFSGEEFKSRIEIMQFVRTDMNRGVSVDFYESDIVELEMPYQDKLLKAVIFYEKQNCSFRAKVYMNGGVYLHDLTVLTVVKVIGNIYENPELIN